MISISGHTITFSKTLWSEDELELAMCLGFTHHVDTNVVSCDITVTAPLAVLEFTKKVLPEWVSPHLGGKLQSEPVWIDIRNAYKLLFEERTNLFKEKVPYWQKFYKHQKQTLLESIDRDHNLWAIEQRMGKTITALTLSMLRDDKCTVFVTLNTPKWSIPKEVSKEFGLDRMQFSVLDSAESRTIRAFLIEKVIFINYEAVGKYKNYLLERKPTHWVLDECFPYDTLIQTDCGLIKIGDIVNKKMKVKCLSWDKEKNVYSYRKVTDWFENPVRTKLLKIKYDGGELICTETHKIYTDKGPRRALDLLDGDLLRKLQQEIPSKGAIFEKISLSGMLPSMRFSSSEREQVRMGEVSGKSISRTKETETTSREKMRMVWRKVFYDKKARGEASFLQHLLFRKMENAGARNKGENIYGGNQTQNLRGALKVFESKRSCQNEVVYFQQDKAGSTEENTRGEHEKSLRTNERKDFSFQRWERTANETTRKASSNDGMADGARDHCGSCETSIQELAQPLQGGFGNTRKKDSHRSGRVFSQNKEVEVFRQEENGSTEFVRVESIEVLERGSGQGPDEVYRHGFVYDITVDGNHNYFAEGILVSNCVKVKNHATSNHKNIASIISTLKEQGVNPKITMLSGMPIRNRVNDLFAYFKLVGHHLGKNYAKFMRDFTHTSAAFGGQKVKGGKNLDELFVKMSNFMIRKTRAECMDVPKKITKNLYFEMGDYKAEFEKALEELAQTRNVMDIEKYIHTLNIITSKSKITGIIDVAESLIEAGKKIVIFSSYNEPLRLLEEYFKERCVKVTGAVVDPREREHLRTRFWEEEKIEVFLGNRMACSMGIDLSCASDVIHCDFSLVPDEIEQANARVDHMKKNKEINIYHSFAEGSLDEDLLALISSKAKDINAVINRDNKGQLNYENIPQELYKKMLERLAVKNNNGVAVNDNKEKV